MCLGLLEPSAYSIVAALWGGPSRSFVGLLEISIHA